MNWWQNGVRFECQHSGKCCTSRGEFGYVYLTLSDAQKLADHLKMSVVDFESAHCVLRPDGIRVLKEDRGQTECRFLKNNRCGVYESRPTQCQTWPFWPEMMAAKSWNENVVKFCPGVNKGRLVPAREIEQTLKEQIQSEKELLARK